MRREGRGISPSWIMHRFPSREHFIREDKNWAPCSEYSTPRRVFAKKRSRGLVLISITTLQTSHVGFEMDIKSGADEEIKRSSKFVCKRLPRTQMTAQRLRVKGRLKSVIV